MFYQKNNQMSFAGKDRMKIAFQSLENSFEKRKKDIKMKKNNIKVEN